MYAGALLKQLLVASVVFGLIFSTLLLLLELSAAYAIMEDLGIREVRDQEMTFIEQNPTG